MEAAVGGQAATQVIQGEKLFDLVVRMEPRYRESAQQIRNLFLGFFVNPVLYQVVAREGNVLQV